MIRREVIERIGLLDENIFYGPEDADYCMRIAAEGWKVVYLPQYTIVHHWRRATNKKLFFLVWHGSTSVLCVISMPSTNVLIKT